MFWAKRKHIDDLRSAMPREELVRRSRILFIDDERPALIDDLKAARFSAEHVPDIDNTNLDLIDRRLYDLILLDFGNVGTAFGRDEGLALLRHIKRVNPATVVLAYTSKALAANHSDFYRVADGVLSKDAGIADSLEKVEEALQKAHSIDNLWRGLLQLSGIEPGSPQDGEWQDLFVRGLSSHRKMTRLKTRLVNTLTSDATRQIGLTLLGKLTEVGLRAALGV